MEGYTPTENYLRQLCDRTFLSLWSFPNPHRDQGDKNKLGKEICDLLVIFRPHILIFSDKACEFPASSTLELGWKRWFKRAVSESAKQLHGAEKWIREHPDRIFVDRKCAERLPIELPDMREAIFHRIVVSHDPFRTCKQVFGGNGSLMIDNRVAGEAHDDVPFTIGDLDPARGFVHVLNESSLEIVLQHRDTLTDLVDYLSAKEELLRGPKRVFAAGEEELLALFLHSFDKHAGVYSFDARREVTESDFVGLEEGSWETFLASDRFRKLSQANRISYAWDRLIEKFVFHARAGTSHFSTHKPIRASEPMYRIMARERRLARRNLSEAFIDLIRSTPHHLRNLRVVRSRPGEPYYVFLVFPHPPGLEYERYRLIRREYLRACCLVTRLVFHEAIDIVGLATEPGIAAPSRSEDALYFDARYWNDELKAEAQELQANWEILTSAQAFTFHDAEFPTGEPTEHGFATVNEVSANDPCICGSGKRYAECHGRQPT